MPYEKQNLPVFEGLNKGIEPDAIKDTQASDMLNLRFTKLGYLVNRNGVRAFQFNHAQLPASPDIAQISGASAIGEFILSAPVTDKVDFEPLGDAVVASVVNASHSFPLQSYDRFMVYGLRCSNVSEPARARLVYVLVPNGQLPENVQSFSIDNDYTAQPQNGGDCVFFLRPEYAGDTDSLTAQKPSVLQAPARWMGRGRWLDTISGSIRDEGWIEHYQRMAQYGNALVIADRQNGDLIIHDKWDDTPVGKAKAHELRMQENCNAFFDIDTVKLDFQLASGEKNGSGVENGMALYRYFLDRKQAVSSDDQYVPVGYDSRIGETVIQGKDQWTWKERIGNFASALFSAINVSDEYGSEKQTLGVASTNYNGGVLKALFKNDTGTVYTFSDYNEPSEIDSLLDKARATNPALAPQYDKDGNLLNNDAADVYIWNDVRVKYYLCTGSDGASEFLTAADRPWSKKIPTLPRIVELETKMGIKQRLPLGVWAYRFVYVLNDREYSSPSAVLLCPDKLWSCAPDSVLRKRYTSLELGDMVKTHDKAYATYTGLNTSILASGTSLVFQDDVVATGSGWYNEILKKVKSQLYGPTHVYGGTAADVNRQVLVTVTSNGPERKLNGTVLAGYQFNLEQIDKLFGGQNDEVRTMKLKYVHKASLVVPLVKNFGNYKTHNSIFTDEVHAYSGTLAGATGGFYRAALVDTNGYYQAVHHEFVVDNVNNTFCPPYAEYKGGDRSVDNSFDLDVVKRRQDVYYNLIVHNENLCNTEYNKTIPTLLRYTSNQTHRLSYTQPNANPEAVSRLIAEGIAEFVLMNSSESFTFRSNIIGSYNYAVPSATEPLRPSDDNATKHLKATTRTYANHLYPDGTIPIDWIYSSVQNGQLAIPGLSKTPTVSGAKSIADCDVYIRHDEIAGENEFKASNVDFYSHMLEITGLVDQAGIPRASPTILQQTWVDDSYYRTSNVRIAIHLEGERLLVPEQTTAFFPSSLLFNAPRVALNISKDDIPKRATKVMVFRTLASHDNDWQPSKFGLVKQIDLEKDTNGKNVDFSFFDDIKDADLDFSTTPDEFDGIIRPLRSLFVKPLKEKVWYGNVFESYQQYAPRGYVDNVLNASGTGVVEDLTPSTAYSKSKAASWKELVVDDTTANRDLGYTSTLNGKYHEYFIVFKDLNGDYSAPKLLSDNGTPVVIDFTSIPGSKLTAVAFVLSGYPYNAGIDKCEVFRRSYTYVGGVMSDSSFYKIGDIKAEDEGVFVDSGISVQPAQKWTQYDTSASIRPVSAAREDKLESSIAWSESGQPSWIKYESRYAFRDGDGDQITGMEVIYSELIVFKERSMHRVTLENIGNNIGRVEEVSNTIGCIAPNSVICYDNTIYFLSWHGFMKYDNNGLSKVDGSFAIELQERLRENDNAIHNPAIRDCSVALNSTYRELYLNIPAYAGKPAFDYHDEGTKGHIYVIQLDNQFVTKFQYETGDAQIFTPLQNPAAPTTSGTDYRTMARLYHTNSYGQLWSAETLPKTPYVSSKVYLEAPTSRHYDEFQPGITLSGLPETVSKIITEPVHSWWRSKEFTGDDKSLLKRLRMVIANLAKGTRPTVGTEFNNDDYSSSAYRESMFGVTGELKVVPSRRLEGYDRGERMSIHIASEGETEIQGLGFHWRKVNTWTR